MGSVAGHGGRGVDLLVLSEVRWGYFRTRKQFLLSRFPDRWRIFFAQPPAFGGDDPWTPRREGNVTYFTVPLTSNTPRLSRPVISTQVQISLLFPANISAFKLSTVPFLP